MSKNSKKKKNKSRSNSQAIVVASAVEEEIQISEETAEPESQPPIDETMMALNTRETRKSLSLSN